MAGVAGVAGMVVMVVVVVVAVVAVSGPPHNLKTIPPVMASQTGLSLSQGALTMSQGLRQRHPKAVHWK
jgi:hypothetical protein